MSVLTIQKLSKSYGSDTVLEKIDLSVAAGEVVALLGKSGSGKSTLVNLLNRIVEPTHGSVTIDGLNISKVDLSSLRRKIGVVEQVPFVFGGTIRDNISSRSRCKVSRSCWTNNRARCGNIFNCDMEYTEEKLYERRFVQN